MATYDQWNDALLNYATQGLSLGSAIVFSIDEDTLEFIGQQWGKPDRGTWLDDFLRALRRKCVLDDEVQFARFANPLRDDKQRPRYAVFLGALILSAYRMGEDEDKDIKANEYYAHLNQILGVSKVEGRPKGFVGGDEETLWLDFARWLRAKGFSPTAYSGSGGYRFTEYARSQTLLSQADKDKLWRHFNDRNWDKHYSELIVIAYIKEDINYLTRHLQKLFDTSSPIWQRSQDAITQACFDVYQEWVEAGGTSRRQNTTGSPRRSTLEAGVYREDDFLGGTTDYFLYPRQPRQSLVQNLEVTYKGEKYSLSPDRPGWYRPLWALDGEQLNNGIAANISPEHPYRLLTLAQSQFWILTLDPDTPDSNIYASWGKGITLGQSFILLAQDNLRDDLIKLKGEGLIDWERSERLWENWQEYINVTVQAEPQAWQSIHLSNIALRHTLQPRVSFGLSLVGGLRVRKGRGWIAGYGPQVSVASFLPQVNLLLKNEEGDILEQRTINSGEIVDDLPWDTPGIYTLSIIQANVSDERTVRLYGWDEIELQPVDVVSIIRDEKLSFIGARQNN